LFDESQDKDIAGGIQISWFSWVWDSGEEPGRCYQKNIVNVKRRRILMV